MVLAALSCLSGCTGEIGALTDNASPEGPGAPTIPGGGGTAVGGGSGAGGSTGNSKGNGGATAPSACEGAADTGPSVLRRLSKLEYQLTLKELFRLATAPAASDVPEDSDQENFRTISALENVSDQHLRAYLDTAAALASDLMKDQARREAVLGCSSTAPDCLESFTRSFGKLAFRRPLESNEVTALVARAKAVAASGDDQFQFVIEALLTSPSFLFRVEVGASATTAGAVALGPRELASRLSFTVLGRTPSLELLEKAERGELDTPEGLGTTTRELLKDPRAKEFFQAFFKQWLNFERLRSPTPRPSGWSDDLLGAMIGESSRVLDDFAWKDGANFLDALTANYTYVTEPLGKFYGLSGGGSDFVRVEFPAGHPRNGTGLLTHASLISTKSDGDLIAVRGKWVRGTFLCEKLEVPADLLAAIADELAGLSYLEVIQKRNTEQPCASCHSRIDPIGVGFAQYDGIGHYDASVGVNEFGLEPRLAGAANPDFKTLAELAAELQRSPEVASCMAEKLFVYTQGRFPAQGDQCSVTAASQQFSAENHRFASLVEGIVTAPAFRLRKAPQ
jgi:hypothetical protein